MGNEKFELPKGISQNRGNWSANPINGVADAPVIKMISAEVLGDVGICSMKPGTKTVVFSGEEEDDGTAELYYGPFNEFLFVINGSLTLYFGKDASEIKGENSEKLSLTPGDACRILPGWKYMLANNGSEQGLIHYQMLGTAPGYETVKKRLK